MTPLEFFSLNLRHGDKVKVTYSPFYYADKTETKEMTVFYYGLRLLGRVNVSSGTDDLVPVFVLPTKKDGSMGRRHAEYVTFKDISKITILESKYAYLETQELDGGVRALAHLWTRCQDQINQIARQMNDYYPGKLIPISDTCTGIVSESHGGVDIDYPYNIVAIGYDSNEDEAILDLQNECDNKLYPISDLTVDNMPILLRDYAEAIMNPEPFDEDSPDNWVDLHSIPWEEVPEPQKGQFRTTAQDYLMNLKIQKWWGSLSATEKETILDQRTGWKETRTYKEWEEKNPNKPFSCFCDYIWSVNPPSSRFIYFQGYLANQNR